MKKAILWAPLALFALVTVTRVLKQEKPVANSDE